MKINESDILRTYAGQLVPAWTHYLPSHDYKYGRRGLKLGTCNELYLDVPYNLPVPAIDISDYDMTLHIGEYDGAWAYTINPDQSSREKHGKVSVLAYELHIVRDGLGMPVSICMNARQKDGSKRLTEIWNRVTGTPYGDGPKIAFIATEGKPSFFPDTGSDGDSVYGAIASMARTIYDSMTKLYSSTNSYPEPSNDGLYLTKSGTLLMKMSEHDDGEWMVLYDADHDRWIAPGTTLHWEQMNTLLGPKEGPFLYKGALLNWRLDCD